MFLGNKARRDREGRWQGIRKPSRSLLTLLVLYGSGKPNAYVWELLESRWDRALAAAKGATVTTHRATKRSDVSYSVSRKEGDTPTYKIQYGYCSCPDAGLGRAPARICKHLMILFLRRGIAYERSVSGGSRSLSG